MTGWAIACAGVLVGVYSTCQPRPWQAGCLLAVALIASGIYLLYLRGGRDASA